MSDEATPQHVSSDTSSIETDEDTTLNPESLSARPENRIRRRRRRLTDKVRRQVMHSNLIRLALSVLLGTAVVVASTYIARKSTEFDVSILRTRR